MKKLFIFATIFTMVFTLSARDYPGVTVRKHNGGVWAIFNLYNDIEYTPAEATGGVAELECSGNGFSFCRVPMLALGGNDHRDDLADTRALVNAVNEIIENSESRSPSETRFEGNEHHVTVAVPDDAGRSFTYYQVKGVWNYESNGDCVMKITITDVSAAYSRQR